MVETAIGKEIFSDKLKQAAQQTISILPNFGINGRFEEILSSHREEERVKRHKKRVEILQEAIDRGEIVYTKHIEI